MKSLKVFDDPGLDRAYTEAYYATMREVDRTERNRAVQDRTEAFVSLFEDELERRDLSQEERARLVAALRESVGTSYEARARRMRRRRRIAVAGSGGILALGVLAFLIYLASVRPFASIPRVEAELSHYAEQVEAGYGEYAGRYYRLLARFHGRLGEERVEEHERNMHAALDQRFRETLARVDQGEIAFIDDALRWAGYFPEREERVARRRLAQNATLQGVGQKVGESVNSVLDSARGFLREAIDSLGNRR